MRSSSHLGKLIIALSANAVAVTLVALALWARGPSLNLVPSAFAQPQLPIGGGAGLFIVPAQFSSNTYGCYLMDVDAQTLCAYQFMPADKQLRLVAARNFRWDRRLGNFNTTPAPIEIKDLGDKEQDAARITESGNKPVSPETQQKHD
ncbi:MAG: hypothetical protein ACREJC_03485 [Tepidisphaeraceae bacterium]